MRKPYEMLCSFAHAKYGCKNLLGVFGVESPRAEAIFGSDGNALSER